MKIYNLFAYKASNSSRYEHGDSDSDFIFLTHITEKELKKYYTEICQFNHDLKRFQQGYDVIMIQMAECPADNGEWDSEDQLKYIFINEDHEEFRRLELETRDAMERTRIAREEARKKEVEKRALEAKKRQEAEERATYERLKQKYETI